MIHNSHEEYSLDFLRGFKYPFDSNLTGGRCPGCAYNLRWIGQTSCGHAYHDGYIHAFTNYERSDGSGLEAYKVVSDRLFMKII